MAKKRFYIDRVELHQSEDWKNHERSDVHIIALGRLGDAPAPIYKPPKTTFVFKGKGQKRQKAVVLYRYFINRANGYTHKLSFDQRFDELCDSLIDDGYVSCTKEEYFEAISSEKGG